jgi:hypothetical protein
MSILGRLQRYSRENSFDILIWLGFSVGVLVLLLIRLNRLTHGISANESAFVGVPSVHHLLHDPLNLPIQLLQVIFIKLFGIHRLAHLSRLPNIVLGALSIGCVTRLVYSWHGRRSAVLTGILFSCSAWTLHVSRFASNDVEYLLAVPALLLIQASIHRLKQSKLKLLLAALSLSLLLTVPGLIWCVLLSVYWVRADLVRGWRTLAVWWQRSLLVIFGLLWLPLIVIAFGTHQSVANWFGFPEQLTSSNQLFKHFVAVPLHLFGRGPQYPLLWLGKVPILDVFSLACCAVGIYFYARHFHASRSRILASFSLIGLVLIGLAGPVSLSLLVPILYIIAGTGITYLLSLWLKPFPVNPLARQLGIAVITLAVIISCLYNLRAYFIAWPNDPTTVTAFRSKS